MRHLAFPFVLAELTHLHTVAIDAAGERLPDRVVGVAPEPTDWDGADPQPSQQMPTDTVATQWLDTQSPTCWSDAIATDQGGSAECIVIEAFQLPDGETACPVCDSLPSRATVSDTTMAALNSTTEFVENNLKCACAISQAATGDSLHACVTSDQDAPEVNGTALDGWCAVDPAATPGRVRSWLRPVLMTRSA